MQAVLRPTKRSKAVDILRAVAVLLVLGAHLAPCPAEISRLLHYTTKLYCRGGGIGVDIFFVLSGFLVSGLLFREHEKFGSISAGHFLIRRGFKIYPAYWLLLFTAVLYALHIGQKPSSGQIAAVLLFYQNYVPWHIIGHTWSIAVEEHFYFLLVLLLAWLSRRKSGNCFTPVPAIAAGLALASLIFRIVTATVFPYDMYTNLFATHLRLDSLFFGVFISYLYHHYPDKFLNLVHCRRSFLLLCGVLALLPPYLFEANKTPFLYTFGFTLYYLGSGCLLSAFLSMNLDSTKRGISLSGTLAYIGSHSYSIYLWHVPVNFWLVPYLQGICAGRWNWWYYFATYFFGSIIFGICMALLIEFPILKARDKWFPSRGRPLSVAATG